MKPATAIPAPAPTRAVSPRLSYLLLAFLCTAVGIYFRLYPLLHYASSESYEKAMVLLLNRLRVATLENSLKQFPQMNENLRNQFAKKEFDALLHKEGRNVQKTVETLAVEIERKQPAAQKVPYLLEADPYNYLALTENILRTGRISDTIEGSKYLNRLMLAPAGHYEPFTLHPYVGALLYRVIRTFFPSVSLVYAVSFTPIFVTVLAVAAFFLTGYLLSVSALSTFTGGLFFVLAPIFIKRSLFGWYDNDPYNVFFLLAILAVLFAGLNRLKDRTACLFFAVLAGLLLNLYAQFWQGWGYLFGVVILSGIIIIAHGQLSRKSPSGARPQFLFLGAFLLSAAVGIITVFGIRDFFVLLAEGWKALTDFLNPSLSLWPDLYVSVGELHKSTTQEFLEVMGGWFFPAVAGFGFFSSIVQSLRQPQERDPRKIILLSTLLWSSFVLTLGAQRFAILCLVPLGIFFTLGLEDLRRIILRKGLGGNPSASRTTALKYFVPMILIGLGLFPIFNAQVSTPKLVTRIFNKTWEDSLVKIREATPPESIINSWWPPGHFIKAIAQRRVTFDGATINFPQGYWMANIFLASDERAAAGILRMLNNSANAACDLLQSQGVKLSKAVKLLKLITPLDAALAQKLLSGKLPAPAVRNLLALTHPRPPPSYLYIYNEIVEKSLILSFIDRWDFEKVEAINSDPQAIERIPPRKSPQYVQFLWDLGGGPLNYSPPLPQMARKDDLVIFENGISCDVGEMLCHVDSPEFGKGTPSFIFYADETDFHEKRIENANLGYGILLDRRGDFYNAIVLDARLGRSLLFRLYFFDGKGLKYFKPFFKESDLTGRTQIKVFEIDWDAFFSDLGQTAGYAEVPNLKYQIPNKAQ